MPMPRWQDEPANRDYKRRLSKLRTPLPRWWPQRPNADVVGGDLDTGAVIVHLPFEGNPYFARVPADGEPVGSTAATVADLDRSHDRYEWIEGSWRYIVYSRDHLSSEDLGRIQLSIRGTSVENLKRAVPFDPTDGAFTAQRGHLDWQLLQNGFIHRYDDRFSLDTARNRLAGLGYLAHLIDADAWTDVSDMHTAFADALSFPDYYGRNLDALNDVLHDVAQYLYGSDPRSKGTVVAIAGFDTLLHLDRGTALRVLDIFADRARLAALHGHPMLYLLETTDNYLGRVGGLEVPRQAVSESPPDLPEPFDESIIIEFGFQIFATPVEADQYVARVREVVAPVLDEVGRYEFRPPQLTSKQDGQEGDRHSASGRRRALGQHLYDVNFAVRGRGDRTVLGEQIFRAVTAAALHFEQMSETPHGGANLVPALGDYPLLESTVPVDPPQQDPARIAATLADDKQDLRESEILEALGVGRALADHLTGESLLIRTDFTDNAAWRDVARAAMAPVPQGDDLGFQASLTCIDNPECNGLTVEGLLEAIGESPVYYAFLVDSETVANPEHPILAVYTGPEEVGRPRGRVFRVSPTEMWGVENNLSIANMDFESFANSVGEDGIFRGFPEPLEQVTTREVAGWISDHLDIAALRHFHSEIEGWKYPYPIALYKVDLSEVNAQARAADYHSDADLVGYEEFVEATAGEGPVLSGSVPVYGASWSFVLETDSYRPVAAYRVAHGTPVSDASTLKPVTLEVPHMSREMVSISSLTDDDDLVDRVAVQRAVLAEAARIHGRGHVTGGEPVLERIPRLEGFSIGCHVQVDGLALFYVAIVTATNGEFVVREVPPEGLRVVGPGGS